MNPNFMHFRRKISFKIALEIFTPVSGHLRTVLTQNEVGFEGGGHDVWDSRCYK